MVDKTNNVYVVQVYDQNKLVHVPKIKELNPDTIICMCNTEYDVEYIFKDFFEALYDWLIENNKIITVLAPGFDRQVNDHIFIKKSYGYYLVNHGTINYSSTRTFDINNCNKLFTLYCHRGSTDRTRMVDTVVRENLLSEGIVTYRNAYSNDEPVWEYHDGSPLIDEEGFQLNSKEEFTPNYFPKRFFDGLVDIVCESRINPLEFFTTEKTAKSVLGLKPFLVLSCQHYYKYLYDEYGIEPYTELFDYSFDDEPDVNNRIEAIVQNIKKVQHMDKHELYNKVKPKLYRNRIKFIIYGENKEKLIPKDLEFILSDNYTLNGSLGGEFEQWIYHIRHKGWLK